MKLIDSKEGRKIVMKDHTLWTKIEMAILTYFKKHNNKPTTYREISRAYVSSSYSNYQKACNNLVGRGWLEKLKDGSFKVHKSSWNDVKKGTETIERRLHFISHFTNKLNKRNKVN